MKQIKLDDIVHLESPTAVTVGMFDGVHVGHQHIVSTLCSLSLEAGLSPVVVTFDRHPRQVLGKDDGLYMLSTYEERMQLLAQQGVEVVAMVHFTPQQAMLSACEFVQEVLLPKLNMKMLVLGYDNMFGNKQRNDFNQLEALAQNRQFTIVRDQAVVLGGGAVSSTRVRREVQEGNMQEVVKLLGRPYELMGEVVHGRAVGRKLGFPTANIKLSDSQKALPRQGVYSVAVRCADTCGSPWHLAVANIGARPTFQLDEWALEVHILDLPGLPSLYGRTLRVMFLDRLRDIETFASSASLSRAIEADKAVATARRASYEQACGITFARLSPHNLSPAEPLEQ